MKGNFLSSFHIVWEEKRADGSSWAERDTTKFILVFIESLHFVHQIDWIYSLMWRLNGHSFLFWSVIQFLVWCTPEKKNRILELCDFVCLQFFPTRDKSRSQKKSFQYISTSNVSKNRLNGQEKEYKSF
jgi:hypothetical protein